jgi:hypothetical protein
MHSSLKELHCKIKKIAAVFQLTAHISLYFKCQVHLAKTVILGLHYVRTLLGLVTFLGRPSTSELVFGTGLG